MEWIKNLFIFLKEFGGVNVVTILIVYFSTAMLKNALPLERLKEKFKKLLIIIVIPLSISFLVSIVFLLIEKDCSILNYIKQVLINWSFSGLAHKILQYYFKNTEIN